MEKMLYHVELQIETYVLASDAKKAIEIATESQTLCDEVAHAESQVRKVKQLNRFIRYCQLT